MNGEITYTADNQSAPRCGQCGMPMSPIFGFWGVSGWKCENSGCSPYPLHDSRGLRKWSTWTTALACLLLAAPLSAQTPLVIDAPPAEVHVDLRTDSLVFPSNLTLTLDSASVALAQQALNDAISRCDCSGGGTRWYVSTAWLMLGGWAIYELHRAVNRMGGHDVTNIDNSTTVEEGDTYVEEHEQERHDYGKPHKR